MFLNERQLMLKYVLRQLGVAMADADEYITVTTGDTLNLHIVVALIQMSGGDLGYDIGRDDISSPDCNELCDDIEALRENRQGPFMRWTPPCDLVGSVAKFMTLFNWFYQDDGVYKRELMIDVDDWLCLSLTYHALWADPERGHSSIFRTRQTIGLDRHWMRWDNEVIFLQVESALRELHLIP